MKTSGEKLRDLRNAFGATQKEFGEKIGITRASINAYENNVNPVAQGAKWKILQSIGIGFEYFDTEMSLNEAFAKYGIDPQNPIKKAIKRSTCAFYENLKDFVDGKFVEKSFEVEAWALNRLFGVGEFDLCFIKNDNEILVIAKDDKLANKEKIIIDFAGMPMIAEYLRAWSKIYLKFAEQELSFSEDDFKKVNILGVIKGKFSFDGA